MILCNCGRCNIKWMLRGKHLTCLKYTHFNKSFKAFSKMPLLKKKMAFRI
jgi:hypothetical protein